jgi:hypothetical protein
MRRLLAVTLAFMGMALSTQDTSGGVYTGLSLPVGDLNDKSAFGTNQFVGTHVGGHLDFTLSPNHEVRAQVTYHTLPGSDWVYHFQSPSKGWCTIAGASLNSPKDDSSGYGFSGSASQSGKIGIRGDGGYTFNRVFSLEGTLNQIFVDQNGSDGFGFDSATWVQVCAIFRFGR